MYKVNLKLYDFEDRVIYEQDNVELPFLPRTGERFMFVMADYYTHERIYDWEKNIGTVRVADVEHEYNEITKKYKTSLILGFSYDPRFRDHFWEDADTRDLRSEKG